LNAAHTETQIWDTLAALIRRPESLREDVARRQTEQGAADVEVRSAVEHLRRQLVAAQNREQKMLALFETDDTEAPESFRARLLTTAGQVAALKGQLVEAEAKAATLHPREIEFGEIEQWCRRAARGLDRLDRAGQQALLRDAIEKITVRGDALEIETSFASAGTRGNSGDGNVQSGLASW
jgi:hypothetical protein